MLASARGIVIADEPTAATISSSLIGKLPAQGAANAPRIRLEFLQKVAIEHPKWFGKR
jgi:hypothetical protein